MQTCCWLMLLVGEIPSIVQQVRRDTSCERLYHRPSPEGIVGCRSLIASLVETPNSSLCQRQYPQARVSRRRKMERAITCEMKAEVARARHRIPVGCELWLQLFACRARTDDALICTIEGQLHAQGTSTSSFTSCKTPLLPTVSIYARSHVVRPLLRV